MKYYVLTSDHDNVIAIIKDGEDIDERVLKAVQEYEGEQTELVNKEDLTNLIFITSLLKESNSKVGYYLVSSEVY